MTTMQLTDEPLACRIVEMQAIGPEKRDQMFALMCRYYEDVQRDAFERDLGRKHWCLLIEDADQRVLGFSTQVLLDVLVGGRPARALYSGDTIMDREHWGTSALAVAFTRLAVELIEQPGGERLYWFLTTKGYRTYRFLPVFFREYFPRRDSPTPVWAIELIDALAQRANPAAYDVARRIMRASSRSYRLRPGVGDVSAPRLRNPDVRFFHKANPGHAAGDELCCIARLTLENFSSAAWRIIRSARFRATGSSQVGGR